MRERDWFCGCIRWNSEFSTLARCIVPCELSYVVCCCPLGAMPYCGAPRLVSSDGSPALGTLFKLIGLPSSC